MKQYLLKTCILFVCISVSLLLPNRSLGQLSGNYTINPSLSASSTNYKNWASAVGDLTSGTRTDGGTAKGPGVSASVIFSVYDTLYDNTNVSISAITGASYSKTITFKSAKGDSSKCRLRYASSSNNTDDYVLLLDGADYITFQQIGMERTGSSTYSTVVQITNDADNNKFIRCQMIALKMPSNTTLGFAYGIGSCIYFAGNGDSTQIIQNRLLYGYNGVYCLTASTAMQISGNKIDTSGSSGIYVGSQTSFKCTGNTVSLGDFGASSGHYTCYGIRIESSPALNISKNKFYLLAPNAQVARAVLIITTSSTASDPSMVFNNWVVNSAGTANCTGLTTYGCDYLYYHYNNVLITNTLSDGSAYFHNPTYANTFIKMLNNNLVNKGGGYVYSVTGSNTGDFDSVNFNNVYSTGANIGNWGGSNYSTLSSWQTASGKDANSLNIDPGYIANNNLHITNYNLKGKAIPYFRIKDDIDGDLRDVSTPDIGADELKPLANDAGIITLIKPVAGTCVGILSVQAVIKNFGTSALTKANITWSVGGVAQTPLSWTGNLKTNARDTFTVGSYNFTSILNPKLVVRSSLPNGKKDSFALNDSIIIIRALRALPTNNLGADFSICIGDSALLGAANNPTLTYKWLDMSGSTIGTKSQLVVKPNVKTSYILEATTTLYGCVKRDTIELSINNKPVADAGSDFTICPGDTVQLGKTSQTGFTYTWSSIPVGFTSTLANPKTSPTTTTRYFLLKTITATGCKATDSSKVTISAKPTPIISGFNTTCEGDLLSYTTKANTGSIYKWVISGGLIVSGQNTNTINARWNTTGTGNLKVTETNAATCTDTNIYSITVFTIPVADFKISEVCKGTFTNFTNLSTDAQASDWTFGDGGISGLPNPTHLYATAATFPVRLIVKNSNGCADTTTRQATVNPIPVANFGIIKTGEKQYDFKDSSTVTSGTLNNWHWEFGDGDSSILQNPNHQFLSAGNFDVKLCVTTAAGCSKCLSKNFNIVGLFNPSFQNSISAVPNPGSGIFQITSQLFIQKVTITNTQGQLIETLRLDDSNNFSIDISQQPEGIYFIELESDYIKRTIKLIKQ